MTREEARREIDSLDFYLQNHTDDYGEESHTAMMMAIKALEKEPRKGHWIDHSDEGYVECSECGSCTNCDGNISYLNFCFSCGAEMDRAE